jgi:hypothetical protein
MGTGRVMGGQQPVVNSTIQLYAVGTGGDGTAATPLLTKRVTTDASGGFTITKLYTCVPGTLVYITATGGDPGSGGNPNLALMSAIGDCALIGSGSYISINEVTTVAAVAALYPFMTSYAALGSFSSDHADLVSAFASAAELADISSGLSPGSVPVGYTVPTAEIYTLADVVAACINSIGGSSGDDSACGKFFFLTKPADGPAATDTVGALIDLNYAPTQNTLSLFLLIPQKPPFHPILPGYPGTFAIEPINDAMPIIVQFAAAASATVENASWLTLQATRTGSATGAVTAAYTTVDGTATAGTAYGATSGVVSWADGDTSVKLLTIPILDQMLTSGSQTFSVALSAPTGSAVLGPVKTETVTISDKDPVYVDYCKPNAAGIDPTSTYCTTMNWPTFGTPTLPLPPNPTAVPGDGLELVPASTNLLSLVMGTGVAGANMVSGQSVRSTFYLNYIFGDMTTPFGSPQDTGQANNSTFAAVARHYEVGDPNDTDLMSTDGLHLRAFCTENRTNCTPGHVFGGMIRVPAEIRPGMTIKVRYKSPAGNYSWAPTWLFTGSQYSPGPGGNPYLNFETNTSLLHYGGNGDAFEIDLNDNYPRWNNDPVVTEGKQVDYGFVNNSGVQWNVQPHYVYWATGAGYAYQTNTFPAFESVPFNWAEGFHDLVLSWDTNNLQYEFVDGNLIAVSYMEYPATTYTDGLDGNKVKQLAMNLMIGNQAIPSFTYGHASTTDNDGIPDGWTIVVQEISIWNGTVADPYSHQIAPNGCTTCY